MNWLAHVFLSTENVEFRLGNLLADVVRGAARGAVSSEFARGARCHQAIDAFTDAHPLVRRSRARLGAAHRRWSGVLIDVFYDHLLASDWQRYTATSLEAFTQSFYRDVTQTTVTLPTNARAIVDNMVRYDLLGSYRDIEGVERTLRRLSLRLQARWRRVFALELAVTEIEAQRSGLIDDFAAFFPEIQAHVQDRLRSAHSCRSDRDLAQSNNFRCRPD